MFGYAAPVMPGQRPGAQQPGQPSHPGQAGQAGHPGQAGQARPGAQQPAQPGQQGYAAPQQQGFPPPQQQGFQQQPQQSANPYGQPQQPNPYGQPQQANPYGQPQQANPYGQPQQPANPYGQPQQPANPYGQQAGQPQANPYGQPQQANPYGQPQQANPYGQPQQANPYGQQANPYGQQPGQHGQAQANPYGQPQQNPYGQPANPYAAPQQPAGYPQQGGYPQAQNPYGQQQEASGGALHDLAHKLPQSAPGTILGIPVARLRDPGLQRKVLFLAGVALVASIVVPYSIDPLVFSWKLGGFEGFLWPLISGGAYLLLTAAPADLRAKVPPVVLQWIPFGVAYAGIFITHMGGMGLGSSLFILGYSALVFGLLARIAQPQDQIARIIIAVGAACLIPSWIDSFRVFGQLSAMPILGVVTMLLMFLVVTLGVFCIVFVVPPAKLPPALRTVDAFGPLIAAVLIVWLPLFQVLIALGGIIHSHVLIGSLLILGHGLLPIIAYFGVLMMASPAAYEEAKAMFGGQKGSSGGGGYPPQGGYGGGYPPQGGVYPPQGGGYPPQGGGYPPQGGGYPPQQGGGGGWQ